MTKLDQEALFFHDISRQIIELVQKSPLTDIVADKGAEGYATALDVTVENQIVAEIQKRFPADAILAEESATKNPLPRTRLWIIDPICGTSNMAKGLRTFCTNIALCDNKQVIAACVIDHSRLEYTWSVGSNIIVTNSEIVRPVDAHAGIKVDVDFGSYRRASPEKQEYHGRAVRWLLKNTDYDLISFNASLGFMYTATGKVDGFINLYSHPWDVAAASFLIQQVGGIVTTLDGNVWTIESGEVLAGRTPAVHANLLKAYTATA